nr:hypothetical protein [Tanacetum cinerariifolium]
MVAYLTKSDAREGFTQIIDFLNGSYIEYALTVNPNIYVSCIKQFWNTVAIKQVNDVTRLQALVDKKKMVITEAVIREIEEEGDEDEHVEDVTAGDDAQGDDIAAHGEVPTVTQEPSIPSPTPTIPPSQPPQDIPSTSQVQQTPPQSHQLKRRVKKLEKGNKARVLKLRKLQKVRTSQRVDTSYDTVMDDESNHGRMIDEMDKDDVVVLMDEKEEDKKVEEAKVDKSAQVQGRQAESQAEIYKINMDHANKVLSMQEDKSEPAEVQEVVDVVTTAKLITEVVTAASATIPTNELKVPAATLTAAPSRRRKGVIIRVPEEESTTSEIIPAETKSKDKGKGILISSYEEKATDRSSSSKEHDDVLKECCCFKLDYFKGMSYDDICPIFEVKFNSNVDFLLKTKEQMEEEENRALQTINETPAEKAAKRRKLNEEVEDLKRHLEIVPGEDDDVYTEATPIARKVPVVDYEIIELNNKPYNKIIRADGTHQLYISFLTLLKNFDREDLEALWNLVKERFSTSKPKNFSDDFLLTTLGAMFEKPDAHA